MSDISITITADPSQAVNGIEQVDKKAQKLAENARKAQEAADAAATDARNSISSVSRETVQAASEAGSAITAVSGGIKTAAQEAGKVSGALGKAVPVVSQLGSAIASAITGPVGAVSAVIGLAIAQIMKMIEAAEDRVKTLKMSAETRANTAYDALMQGRQDYAGQLQVLAQVREINQFAAKNGLTADQLTRFRSLASQIGIAERDIGAHGARSGAIDDAEKSLRQQRSHYAQQEYDDYTRALRNQLQRAIESADLEDVTKNRLLKKDLYGAADSIRVAALRGAGSTSGEYQAWQDLYAIVKPLADVRSSFERDKMLGRSQADLNGVIADSFKQAAEQVAKSAASASSGSSAPEPGTWAWQKQQDKAAIAAAERERDAQKRREEAGDNLLRKLDEESRIQTLIVQGKQKEAYLLRQRLALEAARGRALSETELADLNSRAGALYDLQHPMDPALAPEGGSTSPAASRARRAQQAWSMPLDRLQRLGGNIAAPAVSPEKLAMDRQTGIQERILNLLEVNFSASRTIGGMVFP